MKQIVSAALALCLALSLAVPALAEPAALAPAPLAPEAAAAQEAPAVTGEAAPDGAPAELAPAEGPVQDAQSPEEAFVEDAKNAGSSLFSATAVQPNAAVSGYTARRDQVDYYQFTLSRPGKVSLSFRHSRSDSDNYWTIFLGQDAGGSFDAYYRVEVSLREYEQVGTAAIGLPAGTYYVRIWPGYYQSEEYTYNHRNAPVGQSYGFTVNYQASSQWETEYNDSMLDSPDTVTDGQTYYGSTHEKKDVDYFRFTVTQRTRMTLTFNHARSGEETYWLVSIGKDENGVYTPVTSGKYLLNASASGALSAVLNPGTYYVRVWPGEDSAGTYFDHRNSPVGSEYSFLLTDSVKQITAFVTRLYEKCLGRAPDASGQATWVGVLSDGSWTAERVAWGFVFSKEYVNRNESNDAYVRMLYRVFMDREADAGGYNTWMNALNSGWSREQVMNGFSRSKEFRDICARYGVTPW